MAVCMFFSQLTCSTCFNRITSAIDMILRAKYCLEVTSRHSMTRPNVPVPGEGGRGEGGREEKREEGGRKKGREIRKGRIEERRKGRGGEIEGGK